MQEKYYVYLHRALDTGEVFYIGKGSGDRAYRKNNRNVRWQAKAKSGFTVEIIQHFATDNAALAYEKELITQHKNTLTNSLVASSNVLHLDFNYFNDLLYLNPESPSYLSWKVHRRKVLKDAHAGSVSKIGYWEVQILGKSYKAHRIVYLLTHGEIAQDKVIDHIDRDRKNNKPENLRQVCLRENSKNRTLSEKNKFGILGIRETSTKSKNGDHNYISFVWPDESGKEIMKSFSIERFGYDGALAKATAFSKLSIEKRSTQRESRFNIPGVYTLGISTIIVKWRENGIRKHKCFTISKYPTREDCVAFAADYLANKKVEIENKNAD
jgi:hypothetical protein